MKNYIFRDKKSRQGDIVLTLDAGDWYSGSLFDNLGPDVRTPSIPQMEFFHAAQYDGIILGNHDFDRNEPALFTMLEKAQKMKLDVNVIVSNILPLPKDSKFQRFYEDSTSSVKFVPYLIKETKQGKVGVLGYMSPDALFVSDNFRTDMQFIGYSFKEGNQYAKLVELAAEQSAMLKKELKCDVVVVVIHGGHADEEDVGLLNLPDVDIVLGGHTHESYLYSSSDSSSITSQCGCCGGQLTALSVGMDANRTLHFRGTVDEEYSSLLVSAGHPQCIKITSQLNGDDDFDKKVSSWKGEIKDLVGIDQDKVIFRGDLTQLLQPSISREDNAWAFAHMLVDQFNKWERKNNPGSDLVTLTFWTEGFLRYDEMNYDLSNVIITNDDAYDLISVTATRDICTFYVKKEEIFYILQGMFILNKLVSPLLTVSPGGILYNQTRYLGIPIITDIRTVNDVPYKELPPLVRVMTNTFSAPFFWQIKQLSYGILENPPRDKDGNPIKSYDDIAVSSSLKELDLFLNYLHNLNDV